MIFKYLARDMGGAARDGTLEALDEQEALKILAKLKKG